MKTRCSGKHLHPRKMWVQNVKYVNTMGEKHGIHKEILWRPRIETVTFLSRS